MDLQELLKRNEIRKKSEADMKFAFKLIERARHDIEAAKDNLKNGNFDWALAIAYNAMLNAGRAFVEAKGYRTDSESHHKIVVEFCAIMLGSDASELVKAFGKYRIRRNDIVYGEVESGGVSESEANTSIEKAGNFVKLVSEKIGAPKEKPVETVSPNQNEPPK